MLRTQHRKMNRRRRWKAFARKRCRGRADGLDPRADGLDPRVSLAVLDSPPDASLHLFRRILKLTQLTTMWSTYKLMFKWNRLYILFSLSCLPYRYVTLPSLDARGFCHDFPYRVNTTAVVTDISYVRPSLMGLKWDFRLS